MPVPPLLENALLSDAVFVSKKGKNVNLPQGSRDVEYSCRSSSEWVRLLTALLPLFPFVEVSKRIVF